MRVATGGVATGSTAASALFNALSLIAEAAPGTGLQNSDYKALVCVFLHGGNDGGNTVVPYGTREHATYTTMRGNLAIPRTQLLPIEPLNGDGRQWAFNPGMTELQSLFKQKNLAILANVGVLLAPTTREGYLAGSVPLPPQLFSHNDQQFQWQTSWADQVPRTGWGGRLADKVNAFQSGTGARIPMNLSLGGSNVFQVGQQVIPYMVSTEGALSLWYYNESWGNTETIVTKAMLASPTSNLLVGTYKEMFRRAIDNSQLLGSALAKSPPLSTLFPANITLANQLRMVARLISIREELGVRRQIFFCTADGYDTHGEQLTTHENLLRQLSQSLSAFYQATVELGVSSQVTTFTGSDFGRTYKSNGKGSDHGWGSNHLILGGAVRGGDIYGRMPIHHINGPDDTSDGRWIPTTSTDEYAATLALWFGASASDLPEIVPNINRFNSANLGFFG